MVSCSVGTLSIATVCSVADVISVFSAGEETDICILSLLISDIAWVLNEILYPKNAEQISAKINPDMVKVAHFLVSILKINSAMSKIIMAKLNINIGNKAIISYYSPTRSVIIYCSVWLTIE